MITSMSMKNIESFRMFYAHSFQDAFEEATKQLPDNYSTYIIPNGSLTIPTML